MPGLAPTSRPSPLLIKLFVSLSAALPFRLSGRVRAPSRRRAARDSTASCASVSLPVSSFSPVMEVLLAVCSGLLAATAAAPQSAHGQRGARTAGAPAGDTQSNARSLPHGQSNLRQHLL